MFFVLLHKILQVHRFSSTKMKVLLGKFVSLLSRYFLEFCTEPKSQGICTEERQAFFKKNKTCHFNASFSAMNSVLKVLWFYRSDLLQEMTKNSLCFSMWSNPNETWGANHTRSLFVKAGANRWLTFLVSNVKSFAISQNVRYYNSYAA